MPKLKIIDPKLIDSLLCKKAIKKYGVTGIPSDAFYVLPDGSFLDGSGRLQGSTHGGRNLDHREICSLLTTKKKFDKTSATPQMYYFMYRSGCVRFSLQYNHNELMVQSVNIPNRYQIQSIASLEANTLFISILDSTLNIVIEEEVKDQRITKDSLQGIYYRLSNPSDEEFQENTKRLLD
jgi:hypothetical protein